jgi:dolichol-phosphate mannosyltransferase
VRLALFLPAKDEAENLLTLVPAAFESGYGRVVVCDEGSGDGTAEVAQRLGAQVLRHERNLGLAQALRTLLDFAAHHLEADELAVFMDADATMDPKAAFLGARLMAEEGADLAVGSRYAPGGGVSGLPLSRALYSLGARLLFQALHPIPGVRDYTSGYRLYRPSFLRRYREAYPYWFDSPGFTAQTELLLRARALGAKTVEFPIHIAYEAKRGGSKMRVFRTAKEYLLLAWRRFP